MLSSDLSGQGVYRDPFLTDFACKGMMRLCD